jgi:hypothetical protein
MTETTECPGTMKLVHYRLQAGDGYPEGIGRCPDCKAIVLTLNRFVTYGALWPHYPGVDNYPGS